MRFLLIGLSLIACGSGFTIPQGCYRGGLYSFSTPLTCESTTPAVALGEFKIEAQDTPRSFYNAVGSYQICAWAEKSDFFASFHEEFWFGKMHGGQIILESGTIDVDGTLRAGASGLYLGPMQFKLEPRQCRLEGQ